MSNPAQASGGRKAGHAVTACSECIRRMIRCDCRRPCQSCSTAGFECRTPDIPGGRSRRRMADREESSTPPFETLPNPFTPRTSNRELVHQVITLNNNIAKVQQEMQHLTARSMRTAEGIARLQQFPPRHPQVPAMAPSGNNAASLSLLPPPLPPSRQNQSFAAAPAGYGATPQPFSSLHTNSGYTIPLDAWASIPPTWNPSPSSAAPRSGGPPQSSPRQTQRPGDAPRFWDPSGGRSK